MKRAGRDLVRAEHRFHNNQLQSNPTGELLNKTIVVEKWIEMFLKTAAGLPSLQKRKVGLRLMTLKLWYD